MPGTNAFFLFRRDGLIVAVASRCVQGSFVASIRRLVGSITEWLEDDLIDLIP